MLPDVQVPSYQDTYGSLGSVYDPQTQQIQSEITQLAPQQQAQQSALDQAKVNAFRDITNSANSKGVLFSGVPIDQQAQYVGTKYLPAVANLQTSFNNTKNTLLDKINAINAQRSQQAQSIVSSAQTSAANNAYKNAQLQLGYARLAQSGANSANSANNTAANAAAKLAAGYHVKQGSQGQYLFTGSNGQPLSMAAYVQGAGLGSGDVLSMLQNGTSYDKNVYSKVNNLKGDALQSALSKYKVYGF